MAKPKNFVGKDSIAENCHSRVIMQRIKNRILQLVG